MLKPGHLYRSDYDLYLINPKTGSETLIPAGEPILILGMTQLKELVELVRLDVMYKDMVGCLALRSARHCEEGLNEVV